MPNDQSSKFDVQNPALEEPKKKKKKKKKVPGRATGGMLLLKILHIRMYVYIYICFFLVDEQLLRPSRLTGTGGRRVWCLSLACRGLDPKIFLESWEVDLLTVRTTGKKGQKGERVVQNQKGQIQPKNSITTVVACCWRREFWLSTGQKPNRKKNSGGKSPGIQSLYLSNSWIWAGNIW